MAFGAKQISPIDFNKSAAVGVDIPFSSKGVFKSNYTTAAATKNNLINYFLTNPGERPGNPTFGGGLRLFIFEQIENDTFDNLREDLQRKFSQQFPNVTVESIVIEAQEDFNSITVKIKYSINNTNIGDGLEFTFN